MTVWDGRGEFGFQFRFRTLNLWTNPSWTKLELKWPTQCWSAQTPGEIVWFFLQKYLHWKLQLALTQFLQVPFFENWKTADPCITCTEVSHIFLSAEDAMFFCENLSLTSFTSFTSFTRSQGSNSSQASAQQVDQPATLTGESTGLNDVRKCHFLHRLLGKQIQKFWGLMKCIVNTYLRCLLINLNKKYHSKFLRCFFRLWLMLPRLHSNCVSAVWTGSANHNWSW